MVYFCLFLNVNMNFFNFIKIYFLVYLYNFYLLITMHNGKEHIIQQRKNSGTQSMNS